MAGESSKFGAAVLLLGLAGSCGHGGPPSRRFFVRGSAGALAAASATPLLPAGAALRPYPLASDVASELLDYDWSEGWPYDAQAFSRVDESADPLFYSDSRLVYHVDDQAVQSMKGFYEKVLTRVGGEPRALDVLDICASWVSFLPERTFLGDASVSCVVGVGLNRDELVANKQLTKFRVQDLNASPSLAWLQPESFDAAFCTVSVEYLTRPRAVFAEVARVLRPGAPFVVCFSDRLFFSKAVSLWTGRSDLDHVDAVAAYFHFAGAGGLFEPPMALRIDTAPRSGVDPVFVVFAARAGAQPLVPVVKQL
ncbi:hypothetical protein T492DRAFT_592206 [Pavlovales sp. CCMP2436]|nr:hypothetical protein T492DRAFT_592206 [Pavlovales sp. CCMP2436]